MRKRLSEMIKELNPRGITGDIGVPVESLVTDSRRAGPNSLFACLRGGRVDGHAFAGDAVKRGASVLLCERQVDVAKPVTQVVVDDVRDALARVSSEYFDNPTSSLTVIGVTGTNGKTTVVHYVRSVLEASGHSVGTIGTLGHGIGDTLAAGPFTTPEAPELQRYMREMVDLGIGFCVMEVSSHALALARVNHVDFNTVVFTNLTRDHLDFHRDLADYREAKMKLFGIGDEGCHLGDGRRAVVNIGDATGIEIAERTPLPALTYSLDGVADFEGRILSLDETGTVLEVIHDGAGRRLKTGLRGRMNAENALAAYAVSASLGIPGDAIARGIQALEAVPGRMEIIRGPGMQAIVDYAHTPDALERLLRDARQISSGRLICVFGCGGDRDPGKRPEMGRIAGELADVAVVTSDNPRREDPLGIIEDIKSGMIPGSSYEVVPDRGKAIRRAVAMSSRGDTILIAGKGHEDYQIIGDTRIHFDDREVVRKAFEVIADAED
jgi:UDP-N-acetylmuramyl-tripeptide synthetase